MDQNQLLKNLQAKVNSGEPVNVQASYNYRVTKYLLHHYKIESAKGILRKIAMTQRGTTLFGLEDFHEAFPQFPVHLIAVRINGAAVDCTVPRLFNSFDARRFFEAFAAHLENRDEQFREKPLGIVFSIKHISRGLIVHNRKVELERPGTRIIWTDPKCTRQLTLERFTDFLTWLQDWNKE